MDAGQMPPRPIGAPSLYVPTNRIAKFPFVHALPLTQESLEELVRLAGPAILLNLTAHQDLQSLLDAEIEEQLYAMSEDPEVFMIAPCTLSLHDGPREVRLEVSVAQPLAGRLLALGWALRDRGLPFAAPFKAFLGNVHQDSRPLDTRRDELRNFWLRRDPKVERGEVRPFSSVTVHVATMPGLLRIVYGETDDDIVNYYRYEYFNRFISDHLKHRLP